MNGELLRQGRPPEMVTGIAVSGVWPLCRALHPMLDVFCIPFNTTTPGGMNFIPILWVKKIEFQRSWNLWLSGNLMHDNGNATEQWREVAVCNSCTEGSLYGESKPGCSLGPLHKSASLLD